MQQPRSSTATKSELLVTGFRLRFTNMKKKSILNFHMMIWKLLLIVMPINDGSGFS